MLQAQLEIQLIAIVTAVACALLGCILGIAADDAHERCH